MLLMVHALVGALQLLCLAGFAGGVYWLSSKAPRRIAPRVFKLQWMLAAVGAGLLFFLFMAKVVNVPARITTTPTALVAAHNSIRATCQAHLAQGEFEAAYASINKRTKTAELVGAHAEKLKVLASGKTGLAKIMQPFLNSVLFHTGVTVTFVPALVRLLLLLWEMAALQNAGVRDHKKAEQVRREWGVLLPIMHAVTLLSLLVAPTFYFIVEPGRATRCVYSSGHWYTFTCTCLTFALVISHLYRNREYSKSCMQLLVWYFAWGVGYLAMALTVLATTQQFYHDDLEAVDGIMQALPAFAVFLLILIAYQFLTASSRDIGDGHELQVAEDNVGDDEADAAMLSTLSSTKAKKVLGVESRAAASKAKKLLGLEESTPRKASKKKSSSKKKLSHKKSASPAAAAAAVEDEEDAVLVEAESDSPLAAGASSSPPEAPSAPPMAPPPPAPAAPKAGIKISKKPAAERAAPVEDSTSALLSGIKKGVQLRKTVRGGGSAAAAPAEGLAGLMATLRLKIDGEKEEDNDDASEWKD